jgi:molybdate transport system substrate-binding protein
MKAALYGIAAALAAFLAPAAGAAEIKVIASNAVREPYRELVPVFEKATGHRVTIDWGGTVDIVKRVGAGEIADIVIIPAARIDDFVKQGLLVGRIDLARSGVGVAVRAGAPRPDIASPQRWEHFIGRRSCSSGLAASSADPTQKMERRADQTEDQSECAGAAGR